MLMLVSHVVGGGGRGGRGDGPSPSPLLGHFVKDFTKYFIIINIRPPFEFLCTPLHMSYIKYICLYVHNH